MANLCRDVLKGLLTNRLQVKFMASLFLAKSEGREISNPESSLDQGVGERRGELLFTGHRVSILQDEEFQRSATV